MTVQELIEQLGYMKQAWVGLTNEDIKNIQRENAGRLNYIRATENKLKELNTPVKQAWVGLTNEDIKNIQRENAGRLNYIRATENKLKELNT